MDRAVNVGSQAVVSSGVAENRCARTLHPAGVVDVRAGCTLFSRFGARVPDAVEEHEYHPDAMPVADREELLDAIQITFLLPQEVVEEDPHAVEAEPGRIAELPIEDLGIEAVRLPHLELVDRRRGSEVRTHEEWVLPVPGPGFLRREALAGARSDRREQEQYEKPSFHARRSSRSALSSRKLETAETRLSHSASL